MKNTILNLVHIYPAKLCPFSRKQRDDLLSPYQKANNRAIFSKYTFILVVHCVYRCGKRVYKNSVIQIAGRSF